mmetsp:Transcript_20353/g.43957  ORF Transcript_20353/g.43957 Transcript_20353/m.43957 type:complete len:200 (+) Transcript_20353:324-923(+)
MFLPNGSPAGRATDHPAATKSTAGGHAPPRPLGHVPVEYFCISVGSSIPTVPPHGSSKWITDASPPLEVGWYGSWFRTFRTHVRTAGSSSISLWLVLQVPPASLRTRTCPIPPFGGSVRSHPPSTARAVAAARAAAVAATRGVAVAGKSERQEAWGAEQQQRVATALGPTQHVPPASGSISTGPITFQPVLRPGYLVSG